MNEFDPMPEFDDEPGGFGTDRAVAQLRVPPHSIEAESSVLGGLLLDNAAWDRMSDLVAESDFYRQEHRLIYGTIATLVNASKPADVVTVFEHLQSLGRADDIGGLAYLNRLAQYVPSAANIRRYAEIVRERAILRKLAAASDEIATAAFSPQGRPVARILDEAEQKIFAIGEEGSRMKAGFQSMDKLVVDLLDRVQEMADNPNDVTGVPTGFIDLDRMTAGLQAGDLIVLAARPSMGKAQPLDARVRTRTGWKRMGELEVGDALASVDGRPSMVTGVYPQGVKQVWRLTFSDGRSAEACAEHLWRVGCTRWKAQRVLSTAELRSHLDRPWFRGRLWIEQHQGHFGHDDRLPVDPWMLGAWLGQAVTRRTRAEPPGSDGLWNEVTMESRGGACVLERSPVAQRVALTPTVWRALGLDACVPEQTFVPEVYLLAPRWARWALLRGLLEAGGQVVGRRGRVGFVTVSARLARDVASLVRSLGGWCRVRPGSRAGATAGPAGRPPLVHRCLIEHPEVQTLFSDLDPRGQRPADPMQPLRLGIVSIEPSRMAPCQCISVSHPSRLYVTDDDVVTHNTAFAINIAEHVALNEGLPVAVFSMEMGAAQLAVRIVGSIGRINQGHLRTGKLTDEEWPRLSEAIEKLRHVSLHIDETPGLTPSELRANARRLARQCGKLGLIVVDYLQLMSGSGGGADENRATELGEISRGLKMLAKELQCPVIALSQLNRSVEQRTDKRPMMSDLRESGAIEQDADIIMFIYRDEYYTKDACKEPGVAEIIIGKQRNGPTGVVKLAFLNMLTRFESLAGGGDF